MNTFHVILGFLFFGTISLKLIILFIPGLFNSAISSSISFSFCWSFSSSQSFSFQSVYTKRDLWFHDLLLFLLQFGHFQYFGICLFKFEDGDDENNKCASCCNITTNSFLLSFAILKDVLSHFPDCSWHHNILQHIAWSKGFVFNSPSRRRNRNTRERNTAKESYTTDWIQWRR